MKKVISVIVVSLLLVAMVVVEQVFVQSTLDTLIEQSESLNSSIETNENINTTQLNNRIDELDKFWTEKEKILFLSINHNDLNKVGEQIKRVKNYISQNKKDECLVEIETLIFYANSYKHVMEINPQNIF